MLGIEQKLACQNHGIPGKSEKWGKDASPDLGRGGGQVWGGGWCGGCRGSAGIWHADPWGWSEAL